MEGENPENTKFYKIPIVEYEKYIDTKSVKEMKNEILHLFTNYNNLCSEEEFNEVEVRLHSACRDGDLELIKIYLGKTIENDSKSFEFKIDESNHTSSLFKINDNINEVIIPRTVKHEFADYLITSIISTSENIKTIKFEKDSVVKIIYGYAFSWSKLEEIHFPSSLKELKEGWCCGTVHLTKITISPSNDQFVMKDGKYLLGKSDENNDEFDILLFGCRDILQLYLVRSKSYLQLESKSNFLSYVENDISVKYSFISFLSFLSITKDFGDSSIHLI